MKNSTKWYIGSLVFSAAAAPAMAQATKAASAPVPQTRPSEPTPDATPGTDPTWRLADVGIALVIGLIVGYLIGARRSSAKNRASHA